MKLVSSTLDQITQRWNADIVSYHSRTKEAFVIHLPYGTIKQSLREEIAISG